MAPDVHDGLLAGSHCSSDNILDTDKYERLGAYHWTGTYPGRRFWRYSPRLDANYSVGLRAVADMAAADGDAPRVLDVACGDGVMAFKLARRGMSVVGVDIEGLAVRLAKIEHRQRGIQGIGLVQGSGAVLPFPDSTFDCCVAMELIEHVGDELRSDLLSEVCRVLRPGGRLVLTTPQRRGEHLSSPYHVREFDAEELREVLSARFQDVKVFGYLSLTATRLYFLGGRWLKPIRLVWKVLGRLRLVNLFALTDPRVQWQHEGLLAAAHKARAAPGRS